MFRRKKVTETRYYGMLVHLDKTFILPDEGPEVIDFWIKRNVAKNSTRTLDVG